MNLSLSLLSLAVLASLSAIPVAHADAPADAGTLDTVRVEAERARKNTSRNQNVTVLSAADLDAEMANNMEEAIRYIPGVSVVDMGRFGDNGFNIRGLESDRVAITVDGLSLGESVETARSYEFFRGGRGDVDIDTLKSLQVIKGADSITAGSGALGGAVVFTTKDPADYLKPAGNDTHVGMKFGYSGSNDETMGTLTFANRTGIAESMLDYTRREGHESESWYDTTVDRIGVGRRTPDPVDSTRDNLLGKLDLQLDERNTLGFMVERGRARNEVDNLSRVYSPGYLERRGDDRNDRDRYGVRWQYRAQNALFDSMEAQLDHQVTESRGLTTILAGSGCPGRTVPCLRSENRSTEQTLDRAALDFSKVLDNAGTRHDIVYGLAWQTRDVDFTAVDTRWTAAGDIATVDQDPRQVPKTDARNWNLYLRDSVTLVDERLVLSGGARYDRYDYSPTVDATFVDPTGSVRDLQFSAPSWQLGAEFRFLPDHAVWAQVGRGFRAPSVADLYSPTGSTVAFDAITGAQVQFDTSSSNPELDAEKSLNVELGYRWSTDRGQLGFSLFRDRYSNFIETVTTAQAYANGYRTTATAPIQYSYNATMPMNAGKVTVKGAELEGRWQFSDAWSSRIAAAYSEGEKANGDPLESIVPASVVVGLRYAPSPVWNVTANLTHAWGKDADDAYTTLANGTRETPDWVGKADGYTVLDLVGSWNVTEQLRVSAGVYNLTDREYYLWQRVRGVFEGTNTLYGYVNAEGIGRYSEPGRNARVTVAYSF
ncbi:TonB-dependent hemoglobin/transferrin/lactoferrin family receptor [Stenotrophomonas sp. SORGH_AS_0321]|uniref:TonB-dependent hemoglobin/transferrin/lactoferrin family receptor n=1 Tax=Stenotrophomonas sp. SORGH_AS_0321 TaxID=3041787 RepID=UPI00285AE850|nr:TonB-dependent hemoglobin/transferrin/lactoferrin family receptor [Stenotrophomonas sp. SORGH_AS_0321]MDR6095878.1 hemoglobin/transferrin/lactoferrin receptor protein [Stenotrophomonas sp. SORGH_AS_0321]